MGKLEIHRWDDRRAAEATEARLGPLEDDLKNLHPDDAAEVVHHLKRVRHQKGDEPQLEFPHDMLLDDPEKAARELERHAA